MEGDGKTYDKVKANTFVGSVDLTLKRWNWIVRGQVDYGYISDTPLLNQAKINQRSTSPYNKTYVGKNAYTAGIEAGYDIFSQIQSMRQKEQQLYLFGRYETYNPYASKTKGTAYDYTAVQRMAVGFNYHPIRQIVVKGEYSKRFLKKMYNDEPSVSFSVAYEGFFL